MKNKIIFLLTFFIYTNMSGMLQEKKIQKQQISNPIEKKISIRKELNNLHLELQNIKNADQKEFTKKKCIFIIICCGTSLTCLCIGAILGSLITHTIS